jgi:hypothetical protein
MLELAPDDGFTRAALQYLKLRPSFTDEIFNTPSVNDRFLTVDTA